jgi:3D (Asp-Asp-Asp) domain-containing protein
MRRRQNDPFEKPWVIIAAVVGVIAVILIALFFFTGGGSSSPAGSSGQPSATSTNPSSQQTSVVGVAPSVIKTQAPVTVPQDGVYVRVSYIGGFSGTYGMVGNMTTVGNSGDRVFVVENATGTVSATFHKEDSSAKHEIVVEIYKDGTSQQTARNSSAYGEASVTYTV